MNDNRREPPVKLRVTGLQEAQLADLVRIEGEIAFERAQAGVAASACVARTDTDLVVMMRDHDVRVLEADYEPAGYLAWRDQAPGIAVIEALTIDGTLRRYGLGTRLLREIGDKAKDHAIPFAVVLCPAGDMVARIFLSKRGFMTAKPDAELPTVVSAWLQGLGAGRIVPGLELWWTGTEGLGTIPGLPPPEPTW